MSRALVIAGTSFLGKHLSAHLTKQGVEVVATSRAPKPGSTLLPCDITERIGVESLIRELQPDLVFNCAALTTWPVSAHECYRTHVLGTLNLLGALRNSVRNARTVLFGSAAEYGNVPDDCLPIKETEATRPQTFFGVSKLAQTHLVRHATAEWNLRVVIARPFNIIGPGLGEQYLAGQLTARLRSNLNPATPLGICNGTATRDFIDVRDVVAAVVQLADKAEPGVAEVYNIASGTEVKVRAVAEQLCKLAGGRHVVDLGAGVSRTHIERSCGDARKLSDATGWRPVISWQKSLADMWAHACVADLPRAA